MYNINDLRKAGKDMIDEWKYNVVQSNQFIQQTRWHFKTDTIKILKLLISKIDTSTPQKTVFLSKKEIVEFLKSKDNESDYYFYAKARIEELMRPVKIKDDDEEEIKTVIVSTITWKKKKDIIEIRFSDEIMPSLVVMSRFLKYPVSNIRGFKTKYGIILYENLLSLERQYQAGEYIISVAKLRFLTDTDEKYERFTNWETFVLKSGVDDLNKSGCEFLVRYEKIKNWKSVDKIRFILRKRTSFSETSYEDIKNPSYLMKGDKI